MKESPLEFFCKLNANTIVSCEWKDSKYCLKSCKLYIPQESGTEEEDKNVYSNNHGKS